MNGDRDSSLGDWDTLVDRGADNRPPSHATTDPDRLRPPILTLMAAAWGDLVGILAVCTGALIAILVLGERPALAAFGWAAACGRAASPQHDQLSGHAGPTVEVESVEIDAGTHRLCALICPVPGGAMFTGGQTAFDKRLHQASAGIIDDQADG